MSVVCNCLCLENTRQWCLVISAVSGDCGRDFAALAQDWMMDRVEPPRSRLEAEREQTLARLAGLSHDFDEVVAASRDTNADDEHDPEGATIAFERSQVAALVRQAEQNLVEVEAALGRLGRGEYGVCEACGEPIGEGRLEARPSARLCIGCATTRT
jgi:RNA polymerase-binding protein DksA